MTTSAPDPKIIPDPTIVNDLIEAFRRSKVMFVSVELGVFDLLNAGPASVEDIARRLRTDLSATERLLDACVGLKLLTRENGSYSNTPHASAYLRRESPSTLTGYVRYSNNILYRLWSHLDDAVREGTHRWNQAQGSEGNLFDHYYRTEESTREFLSGMHGFGQLSSPKVVASFDLSRFTRMVDLGGATGHLVMAACERYPNLRAAVFDLPAVIKVAADYVARAGMTDRVELIPGDFFKDELPPADLYSVGRIIHDWSEDKILQLLAKIRAALPDGGGLLVAEKILDDDKTGPVWGLMQSLNMLVVTEGRERSLPEYRELLERCGFRNVEARRTDAPLDAVLALK